MGVSVTPAELPNGWADGELPTNVRLGRGCRILGVDSFKRFFSEHEVGLSIGDGSLADGVKFAVGPKGRILIGKNSYLNDCILLAEEEIEIGNHVVIGWNTTIADSDFHPLSPAARILDAIALSPANEGRARPETVRRPVSIADDVFIGPACTILKGVSIGAGAFIEPGSVITSNVPANAHMLGNPASIVAVFE